METVGRVIVKPLVAKSLLYESALLRWGDSCGWPVRIRTFIFRTFAFLFSSLEQSLLGIYPSFADLVAVVVVKA